MPEVVRLAMDSVDDVLNSADLYEIISARASVVRQQPNCLWITQEREDTTQVIVVLSKNRWIVLRIVKMVTNLKMHSFFFPLV